MRTLTGIAIATLMLSNAAIGLAHPHRAGPRDQIIANGQNHPAFINGLSCESYGPAGPYEVGPAWYGLETAHHGPDAGSPGRRDDCYETTGRVPPSQDVNNPSIH